MNISFTNFITELFSNPLLFILSIAIFGIMIVNGRTDAPNAIATCISTRAISPRKALILAGIFDFLGVFVMSLFSSNVISTIYKIGNFGNIPNVALLAVSVGLFSAIVWAYSSEKLGLPSSESHALIAGISGAAIAINKGFSGINFDEWKKVIYGLFISLILGFTLGFVITKLVRTICKNIDRRKANAFFRKAQVGTAALVSFMHGGQDGQKFIGILLLGIALSNGLTSTETISVPIWLIIVGSLLMAIGTQLGSTKIIKTMGNKMVKMELYEGTCADLSGALCILFATLSGVPVSTTHTKTASIMGVGGSKRITNINWNVVKSMMISWILIFPGCGLLGYIATTICLNAIS